MSFSLAVRTINGRSPKVFTAEASAPDTGIPCAYRNKEGIHLHKLLDSPQIAAPGLKKRFVSNHIPVFVERIAVNLRPR